MKKKRLKGTNKASGQSELLSRIKRIEEDQKLILENQAKLMAEEKKIEAEESEELDGEKKLLVDEEKEIDQLKRIEELEQTIAKEMPDSPLKRITMRDVTKGVIGAFIGIVGHFAFAKGVEIAEHYDVLRSTMLFVTAFIIIVMFVYFAGFRKVDDRYVSKFLPVRAFTLFLVSIITIIIVLFIYGKIGFQTPILIVYNYVAAISILAVLGAGTADLIGKTEE